MSEQAEITITKEDFRRIGYEVIPRAQHEALMAAANDIYGLEKHFNKPAIRNEPCQPSET